MTLNGVQKEREKAVKETSLMISAVCKVNDAAQSVLKQIGDLYDVGWRKGQEEEAA